jgi:hypothetical protein
MMLLHFSLFKDETCDLIKKEAQEIWRERITHFPFSLKHKFQSYALLNK